MKDELREALKRTLTFFSNMGHDGDLPYCSICEDIRIFRAYISHPPQSEPQGLRDKLSQAAEDDMRRHHLYCEKRSGGPVEEVSEGGTT